MKNHLWSSRLQFGLATALLGLVSSAALIAHGGDPSKIHGCMKNNNGSLRIVAPDVSCSSGETALDWNITGTAGPAGPAGPSGPAGPTGPAGPSNAYVGGGEIEILPENSGFTEEGRITLASIHLPQGQYVATFIVYAQDSTVAFANNTLQCSARLDGTVINGTINSFAHESAIQQLTYPFVANVTAAAGSDLSLACGTSDGGGSGTASAAGGLLAIKVGTLTVQ